MLIQKFFVSQKLIKNCFMGFLSKHTINFINLSSFAGVVILPKLTTDENNSVLYDLQ